MNCTLDIRAKQYLPPIFSTKRDYRNMYFVCQFNQNVGKDVMTSLFYVEKGAEFKNITLICPANDKIDVLTIFHTVVPRLNFRGRCIFCMGNSHNFLKINHRHINLVSMESF